MARVTWKNRQEDIFNWCQATFGEESIRPSERGLRFLEEAIELVQAIGIKQEQVTALVGHVFSKPPGDVPMELGAVGVTLEGLAEALLCDLDSETMREWDRIILVPKDTMQARHEAKIEAGITTV